MQIFDMDACKADIGDLLERLNQFNPEVVGISYRTSDITQSRMIRDCVKSWNPQTRVIIGGADSTARGIDALKDVGADVSVVGEGEEVIIPMVHESLKNLLNIEGLIIKKGKHDVKTSGGYAIAKDLDSYPFLAYDLLDLEKYKKYPINLPLDYITSITSIGCPRNPACIFCYNSAYRRKWRSNSPEYTVNEIEHYLNTLPLKLRSILFVDDTFTVNRKRIYTICNLLKKRDIQLEYKFETRVDLVNHTLLSRMFDVGFKHISFGVESGSKTILRELQKGFTKKQVREAFRIAQKIGYCTTAYMLIGAPSETPETIQDSIQFMKEIQPDFVQWSLVSPLPRTKLAEWYESEFGEIIDWSNLCYSNVFSGKKIRFEYRTKYMTADELQEWFRKAYHDTYFNFKYIMKRLRRMTNWTEIRTSIVGFKEMLHAMS